MRILRTKLHRRAVAPAIALFVLCAVCATATTAGAAISRDLIATNANSKNVSKLSLSSSTGLLSSSFGPVLSSSFPRTIAVAPDGRTFYTANHTIPSMSRWSIADAGAYATVAPDVALSAASPAFSSLTPDGRFLYVTSSFFDGGLTTLRVQPDGSLAVLGVTPISGNGSSISVTPDGGRLYTCSTNGFYGFSVGADGSLTGLAGFPLTGAEYRCAALAITPDGHYLIATDNSTEKITSYAIGADGSLTRAAPWTLTGGINPEELAMAPNGRTAYAQNVGSGVIPGTISAFSIGADGALTHVGTDVTTSPAATFTPATAVSPDGRHVVSFAKSTGNNLRVFSTGADGSLAEVAGSPFASGGDNTVGDARQGIAFIPNQGPSATLVATGSSKTRTFTATGGDSDGSVVSYRWAFGDGSTATTTDAFTAHTYAADGEYTATVAPVDDENCSATDIYDGRRLLCNAAAGATGSVAIDALPPTITDAKLSKKRFKPGRKGTLLRYRISENAKITLTIKRRVGRKYRKAGTITFSTTVGSRSKRITGKLKGRKLKRGKYQLSIDATDSSGNTSARRTLRFVVLRS